MSEAGVSLRHLYGQVETRGPALLIINTVFIAVVLLVVMMRFWTRAKITGSFGADDILIGLAVVCMVCIYAVVKG